MLLTVAELIGRFHPVLVHLPIGFLLIAALFQFLKRKEKYYNLQPAIGIALLVGMIAAIASCISGYLLSQTDGYDEILISRHQWFGIGVAVLSIIAYYLHKKNNGYLNWLMGLMAVLVFITGHLGGSITHGEGYITKALSSEGNNAETKRKPIPDVQEAAVYTDVIKPILESRCYNCHSASKQKGKLRLDEQNFILKGGKSGEIITPGKADESELIHRIFLAKENEDHMPPKEKPQLTRQDMELLRWWVNNGADFHKKVKELPQDDNMKPILALLQSGEINDGPKLSIIPEKPVVSANESDIEKLKRAGVAIAPVAANSNYLQANFIAVDSVDGKVIQLLEAIKKQLIWLKLGSTEITDADMAAIGKLSALTRLYLDKTNIADKGIEQLTGLSNLEYINVAGTKVSVAGLGKLKELKKLKQIFVYQPGVSGNDWSGLKNIFPGAKIDTGGYVVPFLATDTTEKKAPTSK